MDHCVLLAVLCVHIVLQVSPCSGTCPAGSVTERGVPENIKQEIVNIHNKYREQNAMGRVAGQPKAANMLQMTWDESIAQQAQALADTCEFKHVKVKDPRFTVGQNLYTSFTTEDKPGANWTRSVESWFEENKGYHFGKGVYDHYTQVIWATSDKVGCGYVKYKKGDGHQRLYVCHYGPGGNIVGKAPYEVGSGCDHLCLSKQDGKYEKPKVEQIPRPPKRFPRPPKRFPRPPKRIPRPPTRPLKPITYPPYIMPFTPKPPSYSPYSPKPRPPNRMPYRPKPGPDSPKRRPPMQQKPEAQPEYKPTREDAVVAMLLYLLIQKQAELEAAKAKAEQQEADYYEDDYDENEDDQHEDEYYDEPEYEDETVPAVANADYKHTNGQNYPQHYAKYRTGTTRAGKNDKKNQLHLKLPLTKKYVIQFVRKVISE